MVFNHGIHRIHGMMVSLVLLLFVQSSFAATWYVDAAKGNDENSGASWDSALVTIQKAIDISSDGDTVVVGDGIYDSIDAKNKRIIIRSKNGFESTVIDGRKTSRCFVGGGGSISSKPCTTLEGFTLCNGNAQAGLSTMGGASVGGLLVNCFLQNNNAHYNAGAAWYSEMENCLITGSTVDSNGGAYCTVVYQCTLRNCTIVNNRCSRGTSVAYGSNLYNCIVYDNSPNAIQVTQQEVKNCYTSDPLFVDVDSGDYRLKKASPCIDAGSNSYSSTVADLAGKARIYNGTVDIGAYEYSPNVFSISSVTAAQRYPWNGLVDLKFTITGESGTKYDTSFTAKDMVGGTNIAMKTIRKSNGVAAEEKEKLLPGTYNWIWDAAADLPKDFKCERMTVTGASKKEYDKVQLWEGGPYWATMNIGAKKPSDVGYYFWWGDVIGYKFVNNTVVTSDGSPSDIIFKGSGGNVPTNTHEVKNLVRDGWLSDDYILVPKCDAAHVHMGIGWRMPTPQEFVDLNSKCEWTWSHVDGVDGYLVRGKGNYSSASIFLPVTGCIYGSSVESITYGRYWSSRAYDGYSSWSFCSYRLSFTYGNHSFAIGEYYALSDRYMGYPIRPVFDR